MFASAFIVGPDDGPGLALEQLAQDVGFRHVLWLNDLTEAEEQTKQTPICFFFFSSALDPELTKEIVSALRSSRNRQIKFAPLVAFCEEPTEKAIRCYLNAGFDDILIPPFNARTASDRLRYLVRHHTVFFETKTYFGPDRRRNIGLKDRGHALRGTGGEHRRIEIVRDPNVGDKILRDQHFKEQTKAGERDYHSLKRLWA